jgi:uncharacterized membrane protein
MNFLHKSSLVLLAAAALTCLGLIVYFSSLPAPDGEFSEFYMLDANGRPYYYPVQAALDQQVYVTLGVVNHEAKAASYTVRIVSGGAIIGAVDTGKVNQGQKWEAKTGFTPGAAGTGRQVEFYLHITGEQSPHIKQPLVLTLDVKEQ